MKVKFEWEHEVDLVAPPEGWQWIGTIGHQYQHVMLRQVVPTYSVTRYEHRGFGGVHIDPNGVSAGYMTTEGPYQWLGEFPDTRTASVALIRALCLEVQP